MESFIGLECMGGEILGKSPINWFGGKYYMASTIEKIIPQHKVYVEVFGGAGHLLFKKKPSEIEVYNDVDEGLYNFFKILRDEKKSEQLKILLELTPHSRKEFYESKENWRQEDDELEKVRKWYSHLMQSYSGYCETWSHSKNVSRRGMSQATSKYLGNIEKNLPDAVERLRTVQIENLDFKDLILKYDSNDTFFYLDPPYVHSTRKQTAQFVYNHEMTDKDHNQLVDLLLKLKGKACLSGYENILYDRLEQNGWKKIHIGEFTQRGHRTEDDYSKDNRNEFIWVNYEIEK